jgi:Ni,Fe-hydrogenase III large subunit
MTPFLALQNGETADLSAVPVLNREKFRQSVLEAIERKNRAVSFFGSPSSLRGVRLYAVLAADAEGKLSVGSSDVTEPSYPALTPDCPQLHWFEREVAEQFGIEPAGHAWLKPFRFHSPDFKINGGRSEKPTATEIGAADFFRVEGEEIHEVAVGPVHAGVIEPGHFRFQCHGERVLHLEISLGYQHRGIERRALGGPHKATLFQTETAAGDTSIGHATAYCQLIESLSDSMVSARAHALRGIGLELERLANHTGDLGALCNDVGYLPAASFCGRLRGEFLNITALICGSRLGRGWVKPGGVGFDLVVGRIGEILNRLQRAERDLSGAVELIWREPSVLSRLENTGAINKTEAGELGIVGPAARASGLARDVRRDFPWGIYRYAQIPVVTATSGDVLGRALIRWREIQHSLKFVREQLQALPDGEISIEQSSPLKPNQFAVSLTEGWRGEICHAAITDAKGKFSRYKIVDPSFHNWMGLAVALRGEQIFDFPLCNKSFNLSYAGTDL